MSLKIGIVGLPNVGKSTLFNSLLKKQVAQSANYPFTTIEPNVGIVEVPDEKLETLEEVVEKSEGLTPSFKIVPAVVEFVDIAGLVKGAHKGEGLGNKFLSHIREVDVICFVVRDFKKGDIVNTGTNSIEDLEILQSELMLKDMEILEKVVSQLEREIKALGPNDPARIRFNALKKAYDIVAQGSWLGDNLDKDYLEKVKDLFLLSAKKKIVVVNCDEEDLKSPAPIDGGIRICAKLEEEIAALSQNEQKEYLEGLGIRESGLDQLIKVSYGVLGLMSFYTAGPKEVRAWTIIKGATAPKAAGVIHTDFERGFIAADIVPFDKFVDANGWKGSREKGFVKTIGKAEIMPENVVVEFKFSV